MREMWLGDWFPVSFADPATAPEKLDRIFADAEFSWAHAEYSQREHPEWDARNLLPQITARCLVITGAHDAMPVSKGREMAAGIPDARFVLFESSGHYAPAEEPERFENLVESREAVSWAVGEHFATGAGGELLLVPEIGVPGPGRGFKKALCRPLLDGHDAEGDGHDEQAEAEIGRAHV